EAEPVAQRTGDEASTGGRAHQRELRKIQPDRSRRRALADDDVELEVLHRRVEHLFHSASQTVNLVDEEDVAVVEVGEQRGQIAGELEGGPRRDPEADLHLVGDDAGQRGLPEPRRAREKRVVDGLPPFASSAQKDLEAFAYLGLAVELLQPVGSEAHLLWLFRGQRSRRQYLFSHAVTGPPRAASMRRATRC